MENKYNIEEVNAWLKEEYGMSYDELSKEFNKAVDLLSESLEQRKKLRKELDNADNKNLQLIYEINKLEDILENK